MGIFDLSPHREPTPEECTSNSYVAEFDLYATWYPQMGGYVAKCWIRFDDNGFSNEDDSYSSGALGGCFDAVIYHDGDFPIHDGEKSPVVLHHCSHAQFIEFGNQVAKFEAQRASSHAR